MKQLIALGTIASIIVIAMATTADAGGSVWQFEGHEYQPGDIAEATTSVAWSHDNDLGTPEDGPYFLYLAPADTEWVSWPPDPEGSMLVGIVAIDLGPFEAADGDTYGPHGATARFEIPDVATGEYQVIHCNDPCTKQLGDVIGGWGLAIVAGPNGRSADEIAIGVRGALVADPLLGTANHGPTRDRAAGDSPAQILVPVVDLEPQVAPITSTAWPGPIPPLQPAQSEPQGAGSGSATGGVVALETEPRLGAPSNAVLPATAALILTACGLGWVTIRRKALIAAFGVAERARPVTDHRGGGTMTGQWVAFPSPLASGGSNSITETTFEDLADDFSDVRRIIAHRSAALRSLEAELTRRSSGVPPSVRDEICDGITRLVALDGQTDVDCARGRAEARAEAQAGALAATTQAAIAELTATRRRIGDAIRTRQAIAAALLVAGDWHSPSIAHSVHSTAGRYEGKVVAHHDDYKRNRHPEAAAWECRWTDEMVDNPHGHRLRALATTSGMAAFTTVLAHVAEEAAGGPVLTGASTYHESRELLCKSGIGDSLVAIPEGNEEAWRSGIELAPSAVFVDSLCNSAGLSVTDVRALIQHLDESGRNVLVVVDNTARSVSAQPFAFLPAASLVRLVVIESLTKYPQLGFDRVSGGVIVAAGWDAEQLDSQREHLGTNIADIVLAQHPQPDRPLLSRRLCRIGRNAGVIAAELDDRTRNRRLSARVSYPGLASHPGFALLADSGFAGGLVSIELNGTRTGAAGVNGFIKIALQLAAERRVPICEGTSFGFDTTRLNSISPDPRYGKTFLRIAAGAEHRQGIKAVATVLADVLEMAA